MKGVPLEFQITDLKQQPVAITISWLSLEIGRSPSPLATYLLRWLVVVEEKTSLPAFHMMPFQVEDDDHLYMEEAYAW